MKQLVKFIIGRLVAGLLVVTPIYLAVLLVLKAAKSLMGLVRPLAKLRQGWLPAEQVLSVMIVLLVFFLIGVVLGTSAGRAGWNGIERAVFERIPGYVLLRGFTQQLAGAGQERAWKPALAEIEEALVPAFIIEELDDGRFTVFIPSVPTPLAGAIYILTPDRVHPLNVPLIQAIKTVSRWGSGSKDLVAAMDTRKTP